MEIERNKYRWVAYYTPNDLYNMQGNIPNPEQNGELLPVKQYGRRGFSMRATSNVYSSTKLTFTKDKSVHVYKFKGYLPSIDHLFTRIKMGHYDVDFHNRNTLTFNKKVADFTIQDVLEKYSISDLVDASNEAKHRELRDLIKKTPVVQLVDKKTIIEKIAEEIRYAQGF